MFFLFFFLKIKLLVGVKHFEADSDPINYFWILLLTLQFEKAIHFLSGKDLALAVHFAIPLQFFGLLRVRLAAAVVVVACMLFLLLLLVLLP